MVKMTWRKGREEEGDIGLNCIFVLLGQKLESRPRQAGDEQQSTGLLHLDGLESYATKKKNHTQRVWFLFGGARHVKSEHRAASISAREIVSVLSLKL